MNRRFFSNLLTGFLSERDDFNYEEKFTLIFTYYLCVASFISIFANIYLKLSFGVILLVSISFFLYFISFIGGLFYKKTSYSKWFISIYSFISYNTYWFVNYGSRGSAMYVFLMSFCIMAIIWDGAKAKVFAAIIILNIFILLIIEINYPGFIPPYPSEWSRITDSYITLSMIVGLLAIIVISAKNNYIKQYKLAQQSDRLKSAFLANMSHEIRTPLNGIMGFTQLLTTRELTKEKKEHYASLINDNGKYLMKLVSDILDISMIESGQLKVSHEQFNLTDMFNRLFHNHERILKELESPVKLVLDVPEVPIRLESDELRIEQVMSNLISNAIKFTAEGYIKISYNVIDNQIVFCVEDTGRGIRDEFINDVFNRFVKNEEDIENNTARGAGIGLALSKELVQLLGGKIWFTSSYLKGTTFYFSVPLKTIRKKVSSLR
jgi:signal transduction histidine kinase